MRLALYCALLFGLTLASVLVLSYWEFDRALRDRAHAELIGERAIIHRELANIADLDTLRNDAANAGKLRIDHPGLNLVVLPAGPGASLAVLGNEAHEMLELDLSNPWQGVREIGSKDCLLAVVLDPVALRDGTRVRVALAIDRTNDRSVLRAHRWRLLLWWSLGIALIGLVAGIIARKSLAPLELFTSQVSTLNAGKLDRKVDVQNVPRELRELADAFNQLLDRLDDAFRRLDAFSTDIAHELRSPIANLITNSQVTLSRSRSMQEYRRALESNAEEFERMRRMVEDMFFLARAQDPGAAIAREGINLREVCDALADYHSLAADDEGVRIEVSGYGVVAGDPNLVRRAVSNLLSNAVRHATAGSVVRLTIRGANAEATIIEVANSGPPIPFALRQTLFDRFVRGDTSRQRLHDGTGFGLGLAIVWSIMRLHGGSVELESGSREDTVFRLTFAQR